MSLNLIFDLEDTSVSQSLEEMLKILMKTIRIATKLNIITKAIDVSVFL